MRTGHVERPPRHHQQPPRSPAGRAQTDFGFGDKDAQTLTTMIGLLQPARLKTVINDLDLIAKDGNSIRSTRHDRLSKAPLSSTGGRRPKSGGLFPARRR